MNFLNALIKGVAALPKIIHGVEVGAGAVASAVAIGNQVAGQLRSGPDKHADASAQFDSVIKSVEAISRKDIMDEAEFAAGRDEMIRGFVRMMNASVWYKRR